MAMTSPPWEGISLQRGAPCFFNSFFQSSVFARIPWVQLLQCGVSVQLASQEGIMLIRKHSLGKYNCFTLQVFTVLVSAGAQFNFADSDYYLPRNWKKHLDKTMPRSLFLSPAFFKEATPRPILLPWDTQSLPMAVEFVMNLRAQCSAQTHENRSWKAMTGTWPGTSYLSQRAAEAGSQCKCSCCLHHPLVAGSGHPRHIWHSLHSGLSHLSQFLCQLSPAWKDPKHQDVFWAWLEPELEPTMVQPNLQQLLQIPFCGQFPCSGPCALLCQQTATAHWAKSGSHSELNKPFP